MSYYKNYASRKTNPNTFARFLRGETVRYLVFVMTKVIKWSITGWHVAIRRASTLNRDWCRSTRKRVGENGCKLESRNLRLITESFTRRNLDPATLRPSDHSLHSWSMASTITFGAGTRSSSCSCHGWERGRKLNICDVTCHIAYPHVLDKTLIFLASLSTTLSFY